MKCPYCDKADSKVIDSRSADEGSAIRRRRECTGCGRRFTTYERLGERPIIVIKSDGSSEVFDRSKLLRGLLVSCAKRPVSHDQMNEIIDDIEPTLRASASAEIKSKELGEMVLSRLADVDEVAYIRFASVYKDFKNVEEFSSALKNIQQ